MREKIADMYDILTDYMPTVLAVICCFVTVVLMVALGLGFVLGIYCFFGWALMIVWEAIARAFNLPVFGYWVYVGFVAVVTFLRGGIKFSVKNKAS